MAAFHDEMAELEQELQPMLEETRPTGRRTKALVALGLGLAAAATYAVSSAGQPPAAARSSVQGLQNKVEEAAAAAAAAVPEKRVIEGNLGDFIDADSLPQDAHPGRLGASLGEAADKLFAHVAEKASLTTELTSEELSSYKYRFIAAMLGMENTNKGPTEDYVARAKKHIDGTKPVMTEALAESVNRRQSSFQVKMQPWLLEESVDSFNDRLIKVPYEVAPQHKWKQHSKSAPQTGLAAPKLPEQFASAEHWPKCAKTIEDPHNQGRCGSCWVFGATGALDSRLCIVTNGKFSGKNAALSRGFGASCVPTWDGCQGGWPHLVYDYIEEHAGLPSSNCVPYFGGSDYANHWSDAMPAPACPTSCDSRFPQQMQQDLFKPANVANYVLVDTPDAAGIQQLKEAIFKEGPVSYAFYANREFMGYHGGVFNSGCGHQANHAVQAIGFGTEHGKEYIQSLNSWGTDWGVQGKFNVAPCVVWHYVIPGTISDQQYPLPVPDWK